MINWFNAKAAINFGKELAKFVAEDLPQEMAMNKDKFFWKKQETLQLITMKVYQFNRKQDMNIYKKAQFARSFKSQLIESGFQKEATLNMLALVIKVLNKKR
ncbi:hypothetical protein ACO0LG_18125 [Undibacterium sp. Ji42W]|uniref:hypothetical protein n=1 Tax=Undibacterium sp. Ji42W TaxID=3413039 RepID=UPI003BF04FC0